MTLIPFSASPAALVHDLLKFRVPHDCLHIVFNGQITGDAKKNVRHTKLGASLRQHNRLATTYGSRVSHCTTQNASAHTTSHGPALPTGLQRCTVMTSSRARGKHEPSERWHAVSLSLYNGGKLSL
jgi:hypothetical protein